VRTPQLLAANDGAHERGRNEDDSHGRHEEAERCRREAHFARRTLKEVAVCADDRAGGVASANDGSAV